MIHLKIYISVVLKAFGDASITMTNLTRVLDMLTLRLKLMYFFLQISPDVIAVSPLYFFF